MPQTPQPTQTLPKWLVDYVTAIKNEGVGSATKKLFGGAADAGSYLLPVVGGARASFDLGKLLANIIPNPEHPDSLQQTLKASKVASMLEQDAAARNFNSAAGDTSLVDKFKHGAAGVAHSALSLADPSGSDFTPTDLLAMLPRLMAHGMAERNTEIKNTTDPLARQGGRLEQLAQFAPLLMGGLKSIRSLGEELPGFNSKMGNAADARWGSHPDNIIGRDSVEQLLSQFPEEAQWRADRVRGLFNNGNTHATQQQVLDAILSEPVGINETAVSAAKGPGHGIVRTNNMPPANASGRTIRHALGDVGGRQFAMQYAPNMAQPGASSYWDAPYTYTPSGKADGTLQPSNDSKLVNVNGNAPSYPNMLAVGGSLERPFEGDPTGARVLTSLYSPWKDALFNTHNQTSSTHNEAQRQYLNRRAEDFSRQVGELLASRGYSFNGLRDLKAGNADVSNFRYNMETAVSQALGRGREPEDLAMLRDITMQHNSLANAIATAQPESSYSRKYATESGPFVTNNDWAQLAIARQMQHAAAQNQSALVLPHPITSAITRGRGQIGQNVDLSFSNGEPTSVKVQNYPRRSLNDIYLADPPKDFFDNWYARHNAEPDDAARQIIARANSLRYAGLPEHLMSDVSNGSHTGYTSQLYDLGSPRALYRPDEVIDALRRQSGDVNSAAQMLAQRHGAEIRTDQMFATPTYVKGSGDNQHVAFTPTPIKGLERFALPLQTMNLTPSVRESIRTKGFDLPFNAATMKMPSPAAPLGVTPYPPITINTDPLNLTAQPLTEAEAQLPSFDPIENPDKFSDARKITQVQPTNTESMSQLKTSLAARVRGFNPEFSKPSSPNPLEAYPTPLPGLYSRLDEFVDKLSTKQPIDVVGFWNKAKAGGFNMAEAQWRGLPDFLRTKSSVTKAELQDFLHARPFPVAEALMTQRENPYGRVGTPNYTANYHWQPTNWKTPETGEERHLQFTGGRTRYPTLDQLAAGVTDTTPRHWTISESHGGPASQNNLGWVRALTQKLPGLEGEFRKITEFQSDRQAQLYGAMERGDELFDPTTHTEALGQNTMAMEARQRLAESLREIGLPSTQIENILGGNTALRQAPNQIAGLESKFTNAIQRYVQGKTPVGTVESRNLWLKYVNNPSLFENLHTDAETLRQSHSDSFEDHQAFAPLPLLIEKGQTTPEWQNVLMKREIYDAAERGLSGIAFPTPLDVQNAEGWRGRMQISNSGRIYDEGGYGEPQAVQFKSPGGAKQDIGLTRFREGMFDSARASLKKAGAGAHKFDEFLDSDKGRLLIHKTQLMEGLRRAGLKAPTAMDILHSYYNPQPRAPYVPVEVPNTARAAYDAFMADFRTRHAEDETFRNRYATDQAFNEQTNAEYGRLENEARTERQLAESELARQRDYNATKNKVGFTNFDPTFTMNRDGRGSYQSYGTTQPRMLEKLAKTLGIKPDVMYRFYQGSTSVGKGHDFLDLGNEAPGKLDVRFSQPGMGIHLTPALIEAILKKGFPIY